jgi:predicted DNA-binding transcriptional regulator AlpA
MDEPDRLWTTAEAAEWLGISPLTLRDWRSSNRGPRAVRLGRGRGAGVRYRPVDVKAWAASQVEDVAGVVAPE